MSSRVLRASTKSRCVLCVKGEKEQELKTPNPIPHVLQALAAPKASRQLIKEKPLFSPVSPSTTPPSTGSKPGSSSLAPPPDKKVAPKSSFRRFSDVLQPGGTSANPTLGGKKDLWLVSFNDVVLRCQRTGTTTLPLVSSSSAGSTTGRTHSLPELQGKGKYGTVGRRSVQTKPRNMYKFLKVSTLLLQSTKAARYLFRPFPL